MFFRIGNSFKNYLHMLRQKFIITQDSNFSKFHYHKIEKITGWETGKAHLQRGLKFVFM